MSSLAYSPSSTTKINNKLSTSSLNYGFAESADENPQHLGGGEDDEDEDEEDFLSENGSNTLLYHMERKYLSDPFMENSMGSICWVKFFYILYLNISIFFTYI